MQTGEGRLCPFACAGRSGLRKSWTDFRVRASLRSAPVTELSSAPTNSFLTLQHADLLNSVLRKQVLIQLLHFLGRMPHPLSYNMRGDSTRTDEI